MTIAELFMLVRVAAMPFFAAAVTVGGSLALSVGAAPGLTTTETRNVAVLAAQGCHQGQGGKYRGEYSSCADCNNAGYRARPNGQFYCAPITGSGGRASLGYNDTPGPSSNDSRGNNSRV